MSDVIASQVQSTLKNHPNIKSSDAIKVNKSTYKYRELSKDEILQKKAKPNAVAKLKLIK
jgi:hypothetical protein